MKTVTTREAQHHLSKVLEMVSHGEEVVITRRGKQVARITAIEEDQPHDREVDWESWVRTQREHLATMPDVGESPVLRERDESRW
ncbi:type II toxin-antitoxin system prevent-host-death family antitoxin [Verrucomicrobiaceae bacterium R5-34]|nr:type II toxin-antitoxin system prevent-host-death family antitoxin [Verrucomicrobiaceae bacterium R5-34]